ncbi:Uncharacterised protein [Escherichia coli]|uniref:Uncharacterized protein n=1 Tax=Escherichia coli TaxID=562 RepID=A0A376MQK0_ECOLX|nr:Uncharacterised protein [Escherichia coli]
MLLRSPFECEIIGQVINSVQSWIPVTAIDFMIIETQSSSQGERIRCCYSFSIKTAFCLIETDCVSVVFLPVAESSRSSAC